MQNLLIRMERLSHHSRGRSPSPDTVPPVLTPLRAWLRKRVPCKVVSNPFRLLFIAFAEEDILSKRPRQRLLTADLLRAHKRIHRHCDGAVDILRRAILRQTHLAESFADTHDGFQMTDLKSWVISTRDLKEELPRMLTVIGYAPVAKLSLLISANSLATLS